jgi:hypothetical protein
LIAGTSIHVPNLAGQPSLSLWAHAK